ncbi:MAG: flavin reductase family protein [Candidatus Omnitrophota bacterium]
MSKKEVPLSLATRLINPGVVVLITSGYKEKRNIMTLAWNMPVSKKPPLVAISVARTHFTHELIKSSGEFIINVPAAAMLKAVHNCGRVSGREEDKFQKSGFTAAKALKVKSPLITECPAHIECVLANSILAGDHTIFIGDIVAAEAEEGVFEQYWKINKVELLSHLGGSKYGKIKEELEAG